MIIYEMVGGGNFQKRSNFELSVFNLNATTLTS